MKVGIIGCGLIGTKRAAALGCHQLVGVTDTDRKRAAVLAAALMVDQEDDWRRLIARDLDAVIVATTHDNLSEVAVGALEAGLHVLVEKPGGRNTSEVLEIQRTARKVGRIAKVGFNHRFHPAISKAREILHSSRIGPLMFIRGRYGHGGRVGYENEWRFDPVISGGGELIDQGAHLIDLARWFLGTELTLDYASTPTYFWNSSVEDNCFLALRGAAGEMAWLHASWSEWKNMFCLEIYGRDGKLVVDGLGGSYGTETLTYYQMKPEMGPPDVSTWKYNGPDTSWNAEFLNFAAAVEEGRKALGTIDDAVEMHRIIEQAYSRRGGK